MLFHDPEKNQIIIARLTDIKLLHFQSLTLHSLSGKSTNNPTNIGLPNQWILWHPPRYAVFFILLVIDLTFYIPLISIVQIF